MGIGCLVDIWDFDLSSKLYSTLRRRMLRSNPGLLRLWHWQSEA
jgi:hypothetical protein